MIWVALVGGEPVVDETVSDALDSLTSLTELSRQLGDTASAALGRLEHVPGAAGLPATSSDLVLAAPQPNSQQSHFVKNPAYQHMTIYCIIDNILSRVDRATGTHLFTSN